MTDTMKGLYIACANTLGMGDFTKVKTGKERTALIDNIANMYCEATDSGNETVRSATISALMLLFWGEIGKMADKCKAVSELEYDDFASKLYECINTACTYRAWKDGKHSAEACIRSCIASRGTAAILYESNLDKNKANVNTASLDMSISDDEGRQTTRLDLIEDDSYEKDKSTLAAIMLIQSIIDKGDLLAGIILDNIAFTDCQKELKETKIGIDPETGAEYKYSTGTLEFSEYYLAKALTNLPDNYKNYFMDKYIVTEGAIDAAINRIKAYNSTKLYKCIHKTLEKQKAIMAF